jgi:DNA-binding PadR family transcriptional regulator
MSRSSNFLSAPRGLLKVFILKAATKMPVSGKELSDQIDLYTRGEWRPSPGSVYFILNELSSKGMLSAVMSQDSGVKRYVTTNKGMAMLSSFLKVADKVLEKHFLLINIVAQIAEKDFVKMLMELAGLSLNLNKEKETEVKGMLSQIITKVK